MKTLNFKYIRAKNFICYEDIEFHLESYGNIVLVRGTNLDALAKNTDSEDEIEEEDKRTASNGTGKSTIPDIIVYALFGKTVKCPKKMNLDDAINNRIGKKLEVEVIWDNYKVVRKRKPNDLRLYELKTNGEWKDISGTKRTQEEIVNKLGMTYETFVNLVVFTDNSQGCFLELDTANKRDVVENILLLEMYREYGKQAKELVKDHKKFISFLSKEYEHLINEVKIYKDRVEQVENQRKSWKVNLKQSLVELMKEIKETEKKLSETDMGDALTKYHEALEKISELREKASRFEKMQSKVDDLVADVKKKSAASENKVKEYESDIWNHKDTINKHQKKIKESESTIKSFESKKGTKCPTCLGTVEEANFKHVLQQCDNIIAASQTGIDAENVKLNKTQKKLTEEKEKLEKASTNVRAGIKKWNDISNELSRIHAEISQLSKIEKPETDSREKVLEEQILGLKRTAKKKKEEMDGPSPYEDILATSKKELEDKEKDCRNKNKELNEAEELLPYYEFWTTAYGDHGIRRFVIDEVIPFLNSRISYWLQYLMDSRYTLKFNSKLEETIERNPADGEPFIYHAMSGGERRRLNLAVSQAFAYIMMVNCGYEPSIVFLDEVTSNVDQIGVVGIYNMIQKLAEDKQVFVTTHDRDLLSMLEGCDSINLVKKGHTTKLVKSACGT